MTRPSPGLVMLTLLQVACSIAVMAITSNSLIRNPWGSAGQEQCLLSSHPAEAALCSYALVLAAASICSAVLAGCLRCVSCDCFGLGPLPNILLTAVNCLWWLVGAAVLTAAVTAADAAKLPALQARHLVLAAAWTATVSELLHAFLACIVVGNNVCNILFCIPSAPEGGDDCCAGCCCCRKARRPRHGPPPHAHQTEPLLQPLAAAAAVAAVAALPRRWGPGGQPQQQQQAMPPPQAAWGPGPAAGYQPPAMPPPPMAGVPYVVSFQPSGPGAPSASAGVPVAGRPQAAAAASSFAGFTPAPAGFSTETPTTGFGGAAAAPSAPPYAPPVVVVQQQQQQQQQQPLPGALTPPGVPSMDAAGDAYPVIGKQ